MPCFEGWSAGTGLAAVFMIHKFKVLLKFCITGGEKSRQINWNLTPIFTFFCLSFSFFFQGLYLRQHLPRAVEIHLTSQLSVATLNGHRV